MNREELIATGAKIAELRAEVARLSGLQKELKRLEALIDEVTGVAPTAVSARPRTVLSIEERIAKFLASNAENAWSAEQIAQINGIHLPTVRSTLSKLRKSGRITDTQRGFVQAKSVEASASLEDHGQLLPLAI